MWIDFLIIIGVGALLVVAFINMRKKRFSGGGSVGNALQELQTIFDPGVRNVIEEEQRQHHQEDGDEEPLIDWDAKE